MPVNLLTHAHGQGYTDLNFLIPELVDRVRYRKGPYYADEGDFSSAGAASTMRWLDGSLASLTYGFQPVWPALLTARRRSPAATFFTRSSGRTTTALGSAGISGR